jgi:hypothetical protein
MVIEVVMLARVDAVKQNLHIFQRGDAHTALADLAFGFGVVRVNAHQRRQIERHRQPRLPLLDEVLVALVGLFGRRKARKLAHRPQLRAVARLVQPARKRILARIAQVVLRSPECAISCGV